MRGKPGGIYVLIGLLLIFVIVNVGLASWLLRPALARSYVVQPGETLADIARRYNVHEQLIVQENNLRPGTLVHIGQILSLPLPPLAPLLDWEIQLVGLAATALGVFISFWLSSLAGLLPELLRERVLAVSLAVSLVNYATVQASSVEVPAIITPQFALNCIKDGFAWSTSLPLLARVLGFGSPSA